MKLTTAYNEYGWKLTITKNKIDDIITIRQISKSGCHKLHKPMTLKLRPSDLEVLKILISEIQQ